MAAPIIESSTDIAETNVTDFNVTKPTGLVVNDLLLAIIAKDDDIDMAAPAGWTEYSFVGSDYSSYYFYKLADSSDVAASNFAFSGDREDYVGRLYRISGVDTATPIDAVATVGDSGISNSPQASSIATNTNDALVFVHAGMDDNDVPYSLDTAGWTEDLNTSVTTAGIVIGKKIQATAGSTGIVDFTTNASDGWFCSQIAIKPVGASNVSGTFNYTQPNNTISSSGIVTNKGTLNKTVLNDTSTGVGELITSGSLDVSQTNNTIIAVGILLNTGSLDYTQESETITSASILSVNGLLNKSEENDSITAAGDVITPVTGTVDVTEINDSTTTSGEIIVVGSLDSTQLNQIVNSSGNLIVVGSGTISTSVLDVSIAAVGEIVITGTLDVTVENNTITATGNVPLPITGTLNIVSENDFIISTGILFDIGTLDVTAEADFLTATGIGGVATSDDTLVASGAVTNKGYLATNEENNILVANGLIIQNIEGILNTLSENNITETLGNVVVYHDVDVLDLNTWIPSATEDPVEQQRILLENFDLIKKMLENLTP